MSDYRSNTELEASRADLRLRDAREAALESVLRIANSPGNWDATEYHRGMANGLLLAQAIIKGDSPKYREPVGKALEVGTAGEAIEAGDAVFKDPETGKFKLAPQSVNDPGGILDREVAAFLKVSDAVMALDKALAGLRDAIGERIDKDLFATPEPAGASYFFKAHCRDCGAEIRSFDSEEFQRLLAIHYAAEHCG